MDGLTAIERFQEACGATPIIVITAYGDLQTAVDAVRRGAFDYIAKPFDVAKMKRGGAGIGVPTAQAAARPCMWKASWAARRQCRKFTSA